jgi:hypothetical protein
MISNNRSEYGILAEFSNSGELLEAAKKMREAGYKDYDCHSPFPIHGMDQAMGLKRSPLGYIVFVVAVIAVVSGAWMEWWTSSVDYPIVISGKPFFSYQAYGPVAFAIMVLASSFAALFGMMILNKLPKLFHPLFGSSRFEKVMNDGFFISVPSQDAKFDLASSTKYLEEIGGKNIEVIGAEQ